MIALLSEILTELQGLRSDFNEFTGYNVYRLSEIVDLIGTGFAAVSPVWAGRASMILEPSWTRSTGLS
jgi:hypothetical protein